MRCTLGSSLADGDIQKLSRLDRAHRHHAPEHRACLRPIVEQFPRTDTRRRRFVRDEQLAQQRLVVRRQPSMCSMLTFVIAGAS